MEISFDKIDRLKQKQFLKSHFKDYDPKHHDVFVIRFNKDADNAALTTFMKNRGLDR